MTIRSSATIVIPVWNRWDQTKPCLESLRPTLGARDKVIVVDNGSSDETAIGLQQYTWVNVITNAENRGFAAACNQGYEWARGQSRPSDVVVFLNNDTILTGHWLDNLLAPFKDDQIGATGPRSNFVSGSQMVENVGYTPGNRASYRDWVRAWSTANRGQISFTTRLVGFALAVRRTALEQVGAFDEGFGIGGFEDDDLCTRLFDAGWKLIVVHDSFVHHEGHATFNGNGVDWYAVQNKNAVYYQKRRKEAANKKMAVSACMIVKDEIEALPECLASLTSFVDEIVIYDTGSTDGSIEFAREAGAKVIEGYWDDDFSRARNASLENCSGEWILWIDADERWEHPDPAVARGVLMNATEIDACTVDIYNMIGDGTQPGNVHRAIRMFRRDRSEWTGRLHEQVVRSDGAPISLRYLQGPRIIHTGYLDEIVQKRDKMARNLRLAEAELIGERTEGNNALLTDGLREFNMARALAAVQRHADAVPYFEIAVDAVTTDPGKRAALLYGTQNFLTLGRWEKGVEWARRLKEKSSNPDMANFLEALCLRRLGQGEKAIELLRTMSSVTSEDGYQYPESMLHAELAAAYLDSGRPGEAADEVVMLMEQDPAPAHILIAVRAMAETGRSFEDIANAMPEDRLSKVTAALVQMTAIQADDLAESLYQRFGGRGPILGAAVHFAQCLPPTRALEWSLRLREIGMKEHCPLIAQANIDFLEPLERIRAAATAWAAFSDPRSGDAVELAAERLSDDLFPVALKELLALAPNLVEPLARGFGKTNSRAQLVMHELQAHGLLMNQQENPASVAKVI